MRLPGLRVDQRFVANPQGNGVDGARDGELVHGHFKPEHRGTYRAPASRLERERRGPRDDSSSDAVERRTSSAPVRRIPGELLRSGALLEHIDGHCGECAIQVGPEPHVLDGRWTVTAEAEHPLPSQGHLRRDRQFVPPSPRGRPARVNLEL